MASQVRAGRLRSFSVAALGVLFCLLRLAPCARAQLPDARPRCAPVFYWGVNVGTAAFSSWLQGRHAHVPWWRAALGGGVGGTLIYAGQRMVGSGEPALRFAGLQTVATGASVARNLGLGRAALAELTFPVFPFYVQVQPRASPRLRVRLSAVAVGGVVHTWRQFHVGPDWGESLLAGMPVFAVPAPRLGECRQSAPGGLCIDEVMGHHVFGAVAYSARPDHFTVRNILTHELGHSAQDVRDAVLHALPVSDLVLGSDPAGRFLARFLVIDLALPLDLVSRAVGPPAADPACRNLRSFYECETEAMMPGVR